MKPPLAFVSYSHDSPEHKLRVLELANKLRGDGVDCHLDQYETSPPEGWPQWMDKMIREADYVLVVCTRAYAERVEGSAAAGIGKGAKWEGALITQAIYDADSANRKFIPVVFSRDNVAHIPRFLATATYYDLSNADGYEALYRRVTAQPETPRPPHGSLRPLPPRHLGQHVPPPVAPETAASEFERLALLLYEDGYQILVSSARIEAGEVIRASLIATNANESAALSRLRNEKGKRLGIAFGTSAYLGELRAVEQVYGSDGEIWKVEVRPDDLSPGSVEVSVQGYDADQIAELRARRILLDEPLPKYKDGTELNQAFLESFVRGINVRVQTSRSPFPLLYKSLGAQPTAFLAACRLFGTLLLRVSGVVEAVYELQLTLEPGSKLGVRFKGRRHRRYSNVEPATVVVNGVCPLTAEPGTEG